MEDASEHIQLRRQAIQVQVSSLFNIHPKDIQTDAIYQLVYQQADLILIAKTGFGKSIIF